MKRNNTSCKKFNFCIFGKQINADISVNKLNVKPEVKHVVSQLLASGITKQNKITVDFRLIEENHNYISKQIISFPLLIQFLLRYPSLVGITVAFSMLKQGVYNPDPIISRLLFETLAVPVYIPLVFIGSATTGLNNYPGLFSELPSYWRKYRKNDLTYFNPISAFRISKIHHNLFANYNGRLEYTTFTPTLDRILFEELPTKIINNENVLLENYMNLIELNKEYYKNNLNVIFKKMCSKLEEIYDSNSESSKHKFANIKGFMKELIKVYPDELTKDYVVINKEGNDYTLKNYCDFYKLELF